MRGVDETLPPYGELPVLEGAPPGSSWGLWGEGDLFGSLNLLTPARVLAGVRSVRKGAVFPLNLELELPDPPVFARVPFEHTVLGEGHSHDDELRMNTQSSSQWDGFRHIGHRDHGFYGGVADEDHGMHHWARRGIAGRAIVADVGRWRAVRCDDRDAITPDDLLGCLADQGTPFEPGDVLLLRTGWIGWYRSLADAARAELPGALAAPGLEASEEMVRTLWDLHPAAVAADNPAVEVWPPSSFFMHRSLLPLLGIPLGELWDLEELAADCAADGTYDCLLTSAPLNVRGGVASPPNAIALR